MLKNLPEPPFVLVLVIVCGDSVVAARRRRHCTVQTESWHGCETKWVCHIASHISSTKLTNVH
jgi:hypothetical protein